MKRTYVAEALGGKGTDKEILVKGWVRTRRDSKGGFSFIELNDGSCFRNLQIIADADLDNYQDEVINLFPGSSVSVRGILVKSQGGGQSVEVKACEVKVYGFCNPMNMQSASSGSPLSAFGRLLISGSGQILSGQLPVSVTNWPKPHMISFRNGVFIILILQL